MFELNHNMKDNAAKIFSELILAKYDESFLLTVLEDMEDDIEAELRSTDCDKQLLQDGLYKSQLKII